MEEKKSPKANLEAWKLTFFLAGLILSLVITWRVFEVRSYDEIVKNDLVRMDEVIDEEQAEITKEEEQQKPEPPPEVPKQAVQIEIVENEEEATDNDFDADVDAEEEINAEVYEPPVVEEEEVQEAEIFLVVEEMPEFPGGMAKLAQYLSTNIKYPPMAREAGIQGKVFVGFVVEPDGTVSNVNILRGVPGLDEEAIRVVKAMPKWKPGKQRGQAVRVRYQVPINFQLK